MKVNVYEFTDEISKQVFVGTIKEYCYFARISQTSFRHRLKDGSLTRKLIDVKDDGRKRVCLVEYTDTLTGDKFVGKRKEALKYFGINEYQYRQKLEAKELVGKRVVKVEGETQEAPDLRKDKVSDKKTKRQLNKWYLRIAQENDLKKSQNRF